MKAELCKGVPYFVCPLPEFLLKWLVGRSPRSTHLSICLSIYLSSFLPSPPPTPSLCCNNSLASAERWGRHKAKRHFLTTLVSMGQSQVSEWWGWSVWNCQWSTTGDPRSWQFHVVQLNPMALTVCSSPVRGKTKAPHTILSKQQPLKGSYLHVLWGRVRTVSLDDIWGGKMQDSQCLMDELQLHQTLPHHRQDFWARGALLSLWWTSPHRPPNPYNLSLNVPLTYNWVPGTEPDL